MKFPSNAVLSFNQPQSHFDYSHELETGTEKKNLLKLEIGWVAADFLKQIIRKSDPELTKSCLYLTYCTVGMNWILKYLWPSKRDIQ